MDNYIVVDYYDFVSHGILFAKPIVYHSLDSAKEHVNSSSAILKVEFVYTPKQFVDEK